MLIEATTSLGDIVMDCSASTGLITYFDHIFCNFLSILLALDSCFHIYSTLQLQGHLCTHVERRAGTSLH
jgi:hypothetical protein